MDLKQEDLKHIIKEAIKEASSKKSKATLTISECAKFAGIGKDKLMELAHNPNSDFPCFRVGVKFLVNKNLLNDWLDKVAKEKRVL